MSCRVHGTALYFSQICSCILISDRQLIQPVLLEGDSGKTWCREYDKGLAAQDYHVAPQTELPSIKQRWLLEVTLH